MKFIARYIRPYLWAALLAPLFMFLEVFMDLLQPTLMARIVDHGIIPSDMTVLMETGVLMLGITLIGLIGGIGCAVTSTYASTGVAYDLRNDMYEKVLSLSHRNINSLETGSIITRLTNDVVQIETTIRFGLRILIRAPLQVIGSLILAIIISPKLSMIFLLLIPLIFITIAVIMRRSNPLFAQLQEKMDRMNNRLQENMAGIRLVKAFVQQKNEKKRFSLANDELIDVNIRATRLISYAHPILMTVLNMGVLAVLWFGGAQVLSGDLMIGEIIAFINYMMQLLMSLIMISHVLITISRAKASIQRLEEMLSLREDITETDNPLSPSRIKGSIEFRNVSFSYNSLTPDPVLKDISFKIAAGEKIALLGATGSGKSTLAALIPRLYDSSGGTVLIDGQDVRNYELSGLRSRIGMAAQQTILFSGTIKENISYRDRTLQADPAEYAAIACIDDFLESLPEGYESEVKRRGVNLSGGQKQRIAIARALWGRPPIIILDDSTSAVDSATAAKILSALYEETESTVIIITQRISAAIPADRIILLDEGEISGCGHHDELLRSSSIYREIYESQRDSEEVLT